MKPTRVNVVRLASGRLAVLPQRAFYREERGLVPHHLKIRAQYVFTGIVPEAAVGFVRGYALAQSLQDATHGGGFYEPFISPHVAYDLSARGDEP